MQTQITPRYVTEEEIEEVGEKPLRRSPSGNRSTRQSVEIHGRAKDPPSLIYPLYLSPPSSYSNKASRNMSCLALHVAFAILVFFQCFPAAPKTSLDTLKGCGKCLCYQPLNGMEM